MANAHSRPVSYRSIPDRPDYRVGDDGSVWSHKRGSWRRIAIRPNQRGYATVRLRCNGKETTCTVHRLVLEAFVGARPAGMECRHLDGDRANNRLDNVCWGTPAENAADQTAHGTVAIGTRNGRSRMTPTIVRATRELHQQGRTVASIARRFGLSDTAVRCAVKRRTWKHVA